MRLRVWLILCAMLLINSTALADSIAAPSAYKQPVGDQFEFIMLAPPGFDEEGLAQQYPASGLYPKGSTEPLWTVDWHAYQGQLFFTPDGIHMARMGPWPGLGQFDELAVAFYADGQLLTRYRVLDLVARPEKLQTSVSHYMWLEDVTFDEAEAMLTVKTIPGETYRFDLKDGQIQSDRGSQKASAPVWLTSGLVPWVAGGGLGLLAAVWLRRRRP